MALSAPSHRLCCCRLAVLVLLIASVAVAVGGDGCRHCQPWDDESFAVASFLSAGSTPKKRCCPKATGDDFAYIPCKRSDSKDNCLAKLISKGTGMKCNPVALASCSTRLKLLKMQKETLAKIRPRNLIEARTSLALDAACGSAYAAQCSADGKVPQSLCGELPEPAAFPQGPCAAQPEADLKARRAEECKRFAKSMCEASKEVETTAGAPGPALGPAPALEVEKRKAEEGEAGPAPAGTKAGSAEKKDAAGPAAGTSKSQAKRKRRPEKESKPEQESKPQALFPTPEPRPKREFTTAAPPLLPTTMAPAKAAAQKAATPNAATPKSAARAQSKLEKKLDDLIRHIKEKDRDARKPGPHHPAPAYPLPVPYPYPYPAAVATTPAPAVSDAAPEEAVVTPAGAAPGAAVVTPAAGPTPPAAPTTTAGAPAAATPTPAAPTTLAPLSATAKPDIIAGEALERLYRGAAGGPAARPPDGVFPAFRHRGAEVQRPNSLTDSFEADSLEASLARREQQAWERAHGGAMGAQSWAAAGGAAPAQAREAAARSAARALVASWGGPGEEETPDPPRLMRPEAQPSPPLPLWPEGEPSASHPGPSFGRMLRMSKDRSRRGVRQPAGDAPLPHARARASRPRWPRNRKA